MIMISSVIINENKNTEQRNTGTLQPQKGTATMKSHSWHSWHGRPGVWTVSTVIFSVATRTGTCFGGYRLCE